MTDSLSMVYLPNRGLVFTVPKKEAFGSIGCCERYLPGPGKAYPRPYTQNSHGFRV